MKAWLLKIKSFRLFFYLIVILAFRPLGNFPVVAKLKMTTTSLQKPPRYK